MDILLMLLLIVALSLWLCWLSPQCLKWLASRAVARAEGLEAQRLYRDKALVKWSAVLDVKPIKISKLVELPSRSIDQ